MLKYPENKTPFLISLGIQVYCSQRGSSIDPKLYLRVGFSSLISHLTLRWTLIWHPLYKTNCYECVCIGKGVWKYTFRMFLNDKNLTHKSLCKSEVHFENVFPRLTTRHTLLNFFVNYFSWLKPRSTAVNSLKPSDNAQAHRKRTDHCDQMICLHMLSIVLVMNQVIPWSFEVSFDIIICPIL